MFSSNPVRLMFPVVVALTSVGCATTSSSLVRSAERLERSAYELSDDVRRDDASYARDAQALAGEARDFRRVIEDRDADEDDVRDAFRDVSESYHALRDEAEDAGGRARSEFGEVTEAYLDIEREMRSERDRLARD